MCGKAARAAGDWSARTSAPQLFSRPRSEKNCLSAGRDADPTVCLGEGDPIYVRLAGVEGKGLPPGTRSLSAFSRADREPRRRLGAARKMKDRIENVLPGLVAR
jgi:hypothetical protein